MPLVRTTMRPHEEIEVSEVEYRDLVRQGLVPEPVEQDERPKVRASRIATPNIQE